MKPIVTAVMVMVLGGTGFAAATPAQPTAVEQRTAATAVAPTRASTQDTARYAARETKAQNLEQFKGGGGLSIYIGGTALAVAALIVLLLVLI
jgi:hypothetical protein